MPRTRKDEAPISVNEPVIEGRYVELDEFTVSFEAFPIASDPSPLFVGLPGDRCQCPHWGSYTARSRRTTPTARRRSTPATPTTRDPAT